MSALSKASEQTSKTIVTAIVDGIGIYSITEGVKIDSEKLMDIIQKRFYEIAGKELYK